MERSEIHIDAFLLFDLSILLVDDSDGSVHDTIRQSKTPYVAGHATESREDVVVDLLRRPQQVTNDYRTKKNAYKGTIKR